MTTMEIAKRLVELCRTGQNRLAVEELYAEDAVSIEPMAMGPEMPKETSGKAEILKSTDWWFENMDIHGGEVGDPMLCDDQFACTMSVDVTAKAGPMAGQRMQMHEICLYDVKDGKIVKSRFFYDVQDCG